jgi:hypothetical protein
MAREWKKKKKTVTINPLIFIIIETNNPKLIKHLYIVFTRRKA